MTTVQLPLLSLEDDIAVTRRIASMNTEPTLLVGHSYGGAVITGAATALPQVKGLAYITAFGLDEGESLETLSKQGPPPSGAASITPDANGFLWIDREGFHQAFAADATADEAAVMAVVQRPLNVAAFAGKSAAPAWKKPPSWYLTCSKDNMIPPPAQELMAKRMGATVRTVASSHAPFMAHPNEVTGIIELAAQTLSG